MEAKQNLSFIKIIINEGRMKPGEKGQEEKRE